MRGLLGFLPLVSRRSGGALATLGLSLVAAVAGVGLLGISGWFLTGAAVTSAALSFNLFGPSALVRAFSFIRIGARYGEKLVGHDLTLRLLADIREWLFERLIPRVPLAGIGLRHGDLVSRLVADVEALDTAFMTVIGPGLTVIALGLPLAVTLAMLIPQAAVIFGAGFASATLLVPCILVARTRRIGSDLVDAKADLRMAILDGVEGHADIVAFGRTRQMGAAVAVAAERVSRGGDRQNRIGASANAAVLFLAGTTGLGVLLCGVGAPREGALSGPLLVGLVLAVLASFETAALVVRGAGRLGVVLAAADRLRALASFPPSVSDPSRPVRLPVGGGLRFEDVWFSYRPERPLLKGISLECPPGSRTALVGESGCGKSTILDLALRLVEPETGCISVAGTPVADVAQHELHARVALMSQGTPVFLGTIADNLRLGRVDADDAALWNVLRRVRLEGFVAGLPDGLLTWCGEGGRTLSGGEARRLCLARILLTRADLLLLDEPTSGLDRETEQAFFETLAEATEQRTVLLVTHAQLPDGTVDRTFALVAGTLTALL